MPFPLTVSLSIRQLASLVSWTIMSTRKGKLSNFRLFQRSSKNTPSSSQHTATHTSRESSPAPALAHSSSKRVDSPQLSGRSIPNENNRTATSKHTISIKDQEPSKKVMDKSTYPDDVWVEICRHVESTRDLSSLNQANKHMQGVSQQALWKNGLCIHKIRPHDLEDYLSLHRERLSKVWAVGFHNYPHKSYDDNTYCRQAESLTPFLEACENVEKIRFRSEYMLHWHRALNNKKKLKSLMIEQRRLTRLIEGIDLQLSIAYLLDFKTLVLMVPFDCPKLEELVLSQVKFRDDSADQTSLSATSTTDYNFKLKTFILDNYSPFKDDHSVPPRTGFHLLGKKLRPTNFVLRIPSCDWLLEELQGLLERWADCLENLEIIVRGNNAALKLKRALPKLTYLRMGISIDHKSFKAPSLVEFQYSTKSSQSHVALAKELEKGDFLPGIRKLGVYTYEDCCTLYRDVPQSRPHLKIFKCRPSAERSDFLARFYERKLSEA